MDLQTRKIQFIQEFLKYANTNILDKFEEMLKQEREKEFEKEIEPMTLMEYEQRIDKAFEDVKNNRVKSAKNLKNELTNTMSNSYESAKFKGIKKTGQNSRDYHYFY